MGFVFHTLSLFKHIPTWQKNGKADSLFRVTECPYFQQAPEPILFKSCCLAVVLWELMDNIQNAQQEDPTFPERPQEETDFWRTMWKVIQWIHTSLTPKYLKDPEVIWV